MSCSESKPRGVGLEDRSATMIIFDYQLSTARNARAEQESLASADAMDAMALRYDWLLGDVIIKVGSQDLSARWGWVPILDFAASLRRIGAELAQHDGADSEFEFTESDAKIQFRGRGKNVLISATYAAGEGTVPLDEFFRAIGEFTERLVAEICREHPSLMQNEAFKRLLP